MTGGELLLGQSLFSWLVEYGYFILPVLIVLFGLVAGFTAGVFASLGVFNPFIVFAIWVLTTTTVDSCLYFLGKFGSNFLYRFKRARKILNRLRRAESSPYDSSWLSVFKRHFIKIFFFVKVSPTVAVSDALAIIAGAINIRFSRMYIATFLGQIVWSGIFLSLGYYFGGAVQDLNFLINTTGIILGIVFILILLYIKFVHKYLVSRLSNILSAIKELLSPHADSDYDTDDAK